MQPYNQQKMSTDTFYRPPWTCGKYNASKHVAVMFNLLSRMSYFFEEESADVIGLVLATGRNNEIKISTISDKLMIASSSIECFFNQLCSSHLLASNKITTKHISEYRKECIDLAAPPATKAYTEKLKEEGVMSASQAYANAICDIGEIYDVTFELTYRCFEKCIHCYNPGATRNDDEQDSRSRFKELTWIDYKNIIDDLISKGLVVATITGGDPFKHPCVWQIIDYLYQHDIAISVFTNGLGLIGKERRLADYFPYVVQFSLYSGDPEIHDKITRTRGSWQLTIGVMDCLHELGVPIDIACPLMQTNLKSYFSIKPIIKKYGSSKAFDLMLTDSNDGDKCVSQHLRLTPEQLEVVLMDKDIIQHVTADDRDNIDTSDLKFLNGPPCGACRSSFCISPDGDILPCVAFRKVLGNVHSKRVSDIANSSPFVKQWSQITSQDYGECYTHEYCFYCNFCPGNNYNDNGAPLNGGENNCYYAKVRYTAKMRLMNGEDILHGKTIEESISQLTIVDDQPKHEFKGQVRDPSILSYH